MNFRHPYLILKACSTKTHETNYLLRRPFKKIKFVGNEQQLRLRFQILTCERAYSLRVVWPAEEVGDQDDQLTDTP
jgi:hypothetical protein